MIIDKTAIRIIFLVFGGNTSAQLVLVVNCVCNYKGTVNQNPSNRFKKIGMSPFYNLFMVNHFASYFFSNKVLTTLVPTLSKEVSL
jgi:hypothetical protein